MVQNKDFYAYFIIQNTIHKTILDLFLVNIYESEMTFVILAETYITVSQFIYKIKDCD